jgi:hypothetical protein
MTWLARIDSTKTPDELLETARAYLASWSEAEIALLPEECRPPALASTTELQDYAWQLARYHGHGDNARLVYRAATFFARASIRLAELVTREPRGDH